MKLFVHQLLIVLLFTLTFSNSFSQSGVVSGIVTDLVNNEFVPYATVGLVGTDFGTQSDDSGRFEISGIPSGLYNIQISCVGYKLQTIFEIQVSNAIPVNLQIQLEPSSTELNEVVVQGNSSNNKSESPTSLKTIGTNEIQRNPGGGRDISKVLQSLPGVNAGVSFRNDIVIRGGAPNENRFYLDGMEIPNINHFATQGSNGGPVGMLNVDFIKSVDFFSSSFPASRGNALSSVIEFTQKDGRTDHFGFSATLGSSDLGLTIEGPTGKNSSLLFSTRRSYLQLLFKSLGLPFLPTYNDYQFKEKFKIISEKGLVRELILYTSCDGHGEQAEYQRNGLVYNQLMDRIDDLCESIPRLTVDIMGTYNALSVPSYSKLIKDVYSFANKWLAITPSKWGITLIRMNSTTQGGTIVLPCVFV